MQFELGYQVRSLRQQLEVTKRRHVDHGILACLNVFSIHATASAVNRPLVAITTTCTRGGSHSATWASALGTSDANRFTNRFGASETGPDGEFQRDAGGRQRLVVSPAACVVDERRQRVGPGGSGWPVRAGHVPLSCYGEAEVTVATFPVIDGVRWAVLGDLAEAGGRRLGRRARVCKVPARVEFGPEVVRAPTGKADYRWARAVLQAAAA